jgi:NADH-quinone oxidoreductase subunit M
MFQVQIVLAVLGTAGIVLGAWYMLTLTRAVFFGPLKEPVHHGPPVPDVTFREWAALVPIMALCLLLGLFPQPAIDVARDDLQVVESLVQKRPATGSNVAVQAHPAAASVQEGNHGE